MLAYQDLVHTTAYRLLGAEADAQDMAQEVFLKAYDRFADLNGRPGAGGWLKTVTRNLCLNHLQRYRARWRFFSEFSRGDDDDADDRAWDVPVESTSAAETDAVDRRELLEQALLKLPAAQRVPLVLYHFEELSYEEIAARLGVSLSKLKTDIHRGREALRKKLQLGIHAAEFGADERAAAN